MEVKELQFSKYAALYLCIALIYLFLFYTEVTGFRLRIPENVVEAQRVPVEQPETEEDGNDG